MYQFYALLETPQFPGGKEYARRNHEFLRVIFLNRAAEDLIGCTLAEAFYQSVLAPYQLLVVGDPLCAVAGWLRLPFWPCVVFMAIGKGLRYLTLTSALVWML